MSNPESTVLEPLPANTAAADAAINPIQYPEGTPPPAKAAKKTPPKINIRSNKDGSLNVTEQREMTLSQETVGGNSIQKSLLDILSGNLAGLNDQDRAKTIDAANWMEVASSDPQKADWRIIVVRRGPPQHKKKLLDTTAPVCDIPLCNFTQMMTSIKDMAGGGVFVFKVNNSSGAFQHGGIVTISTSSCPPKFPASEDDEEEDPELSAVQKKEQEIELERKQIELDEQRERAAELRRSREAKNMPPPPPAPVDNTQLLLAGMDKMMTMLMTGLKEVVTSLKPTAPPPPPPDNMPLMIEMLKAGRESSAEAAKASAEANARAAEASAKAAIETAKIQAASAESIAKHQAEVAKASAEQAKEMRDIERKNSDRIIDMMKESMGSKNSIKDALDLMDRGRKQALELVDRDADNDTGGGFWSKAGDVLLGGIKSISENPEAAGVIAALLQRQAPAQGENFSQEELQRVAAIVQQNRQRQLPNRTAPQLTNNPQPINPAQFPAPAPVEVMPKLNGHDEFTGGLDEEESPQQIAAPPAQELTGSVPSVVTRVLMVACDEMKAHKAQHTWTELALQHWGQFINQLEQAGEDKWFETIQANCDPKVYGKLTELMWEGDCSDGQRFNAALKQLLTPQ